MTKRKITETIKEYDAEGRLTRETVTETVEDDDTTYVPYAPYIPNYPYYPTCTNTPDSTTTSTTSITYANGHMQTDATADEA